MTNKYGSYKPIATKAAAPLGMRKAINRLLFLSLLMLSLACRERKDSADYKNPVLPVEVRVSDLLGRMSLEEKFGQLFMVAGNLSDGKEKYRHGIFGLQPGSEGKTKAEAGQLLVQASASGARQSVQKANAIQRFFVEETRLGIPVIIFGEALHGLTENEAIAYPQAIGLAATWDTALMGEVAFAIASEARSRGIRQVLSPVINIARDVRWGRTEETYGEDPFLTASMALAYVSPFAKMGIITTPKHFVANVGDGGRDSYPIHFSERLMEEIYFPAFKACINEGHAISLMTAYNSFDGRQCTANKWLLNEKLKKEWGFQGFVISDAGATGGANVLHFTAKDYTESTVQAISNGLDVIFQTSIDHLPLFYDAFEKGLIDEKAIDEAVRRVLRAKFRLGLFENPYADEQAADAWSNSHVQRELARKAALESIVLLKNDRQTLPLKKTIASMAVIGSDATEARLGGYSGSGNQVVNILDGLKQKAGKQCAISYAEGVSRDSSTFVTIASEYLFHTENGQLKPGLKGEYFNNTRLDGEPDLNRIDEVIDFRWTMFSPDPSVINANEYAVRWTGMLLAPQTAWFNIGLQGDDGYRLYLNDELLIDNWHKQTNRQITKPFHFTKGKTYALRIEFYETVGNVSLRLVWNAALHPSWEREVAEAVALAMKSEVIVVVAGIEEGEFRDRAYLSLPGHQETLIRRVAATGKPVVVLLVGGSAITMQGWYDQVGAIVDVWYPGEEGGNAIADVLFGNYNPAGRLPVTFPIHEAQLPLYYNHKPTGRGDDYVNLSGKPMFPFGFGLSYTSFTYSDLRIHKPEIMANDSTLVSFTLTNNGNADGDEVVQLYIRDLIASVARPVTELKGFQRIHLKRGEQQEIGFMITPTLLSMLDEKLHNCVEAGDFRIMIGASSTDIRLSGILRVKQQKGR